MDGSTGVWILGGYQSNFARNLSKENRDFAALTAGVVEGALASAKVDVAGDYQVEGAHTFGTLNFGGSTATTVSFVVSRGA